MLTDEAGRVVDGAGAGSRGVVMADATFIARGYQAQAIVDCRRLVAIHRRVLLVLPTGGGKTVIAALIIKGAVAKVKRALFLAHRREIVAQSFWKLVDAGLPESAVGVMMADGIIPGRDGQPYNAKRPLAPVQVASVQTLARRPKPGADVVFVDEAHHGIADSYTDLVEFYVESGAKIVGLTATPARGDGRGLCGAFDHLHQIAQPAELIAGGYLSDPECWAMKAPNLSRVKITAGDYNLGELGEAMDTAVLTGNVVREYQRHGDGRTGVVFAVNTAHSRHIADRFNAAGIVAEHLDGTTPATERDAILRRLAVGQTQVLSNCAVCTEGWDLPRAKYLGIARPTKSLALYLQMAGRILRPWQGVSPVIVDHGGCMGQHGLPQDDRVWSLDSKRHAAPSKPTIRTCPKCGRVVPLPLRVCPAPAIPPEPACGYVWPELAIPVETDGDATRMSPGQIRTAEETAADDVKRADLRKIINREVWTRGADRARVLRTDKAEEATEINRAMVRHFRCRRPDMDVEQLTEALAWVRTLPPAVAPVVLAKVAAPVAAVPYEAPPARTSDDACAKCGRWVSGEVLCGGCGSLLVDPRRVEVLPGSTRPVVSMAAPVAQTEEHETWVM